MADTADTTKTQTWVDGALDTIDDDADYAAYCEECAYERYLAECVTLEDDAE